MPSAQALPGNRLAEARERPRLSARALVGEATGALGDIGTFVPLAVGMVQIAGSDPATLLVTAGAVNIWGGLPFRIPMAVQPMKAICALAIAGSLTGAQSLVAGLVTGASMFLLGVSGRLEAVARLIPSAVLRALQFTVACELLVRGLRSAFAAPGDAPPAFPLAALPVILAACAIPALWLLRRRLEFVAIALLAAGVAFAGWRQPALLAVPQLQMWAPRLAQFDYSAVQGIWLGGLPQLPLTLLNSVLAVSALAAQLYPQHARRSEPTRVAVSVGIMNLLVCPLGGMPLCHGSGGLAGQHKLGARSGLSVILLGAAKLGFGLLLGGYALAWMTAFPQRILGLFLLVAGWSLAEASRAWKTRTGLWVSGAMITVYFGSGLLLAAFAAGWLAGWWARRGEGRKTW